MVNELPGPDRFGENVREFRQEVGLTRADLLRRLEEGGFPMHMTTLRRIEGGEKEPRLGEAIAIAHALGVDVKALINSQTDGKQKRFNVRFHSAWMTYSAEIDQAAHTFSRLSQAETELRQCLNVIDTDEEAASEIDPHQVEYARDLLAAFSDPVVSAAWGKRRVELGLNNSTNAQRGDDNAR